MWRIIGQVRDQSDKGRPSAIVANAFGDLSIEVRNHRQHEIRRMLRPVITQSFHNGAMVEADGRLQNDQKLGGEACPSAPQDLVVSVLNTYTGGSFNQVERIEQLLNVEQADFPGMLLPGERFLESVGGALMTSAGVVINNG